MSRGMSISVMYIARIRWCCITNSSPSLLWSNVHQRFLQISTNLAIRIHDRILWDFYTNILKTAAVIISVAVIITKLFWTSGKDLSGILSTFDIINKITLGHGQTIKRAWLHSTGTNLALMLMTIWFCAEPWKQNKADLVEIKLKIWIWQFRSSHTWTLWN